MKNRKQKGKRWLCSLLCLPVLLQTVMISAAAYDPPDDFTDQTLEDVITRFRTENGLDESNFSLSYYNTVTGESYAFNEDKFMVAASTFKLPLNMYYYEMERDGEIASDAYIPEAGVTLDVAHEQSLVYSNNECSIGMLYHLGVFSDYKACMRKYFTMEDDKIDAIYYADNYYCTHMMMDALKYLYTHSDDFEEMLGYMKQAQPNEYFAAGVPEDCEVAHKYGWYEGAVNDVGIIYTAEPFLLAVYTRNTGEWIVSNTAKLLYAYHVWNESQQTVETGVTLDVVMQPLKPQEEETETSEETKPSGGRTLPETEESEAVPIRRGSLWQIPAAVLTALGLSGGLTALFLSVRHRKKRGLDRTE